MPIKPARIFRVEPEIQLSDLLPLLSDARARTEKTYEGEKFELITIVRDVNWIEEGRSFGGRLLFETLEVYIQIDGKPQPVKRVHMVEFIFCEGSKYFIAFSNQNLAEKAAYLLNNFLGDTVDILKVFIPGTMFTLFLEQNPNIPKRIDWSDLSIPGINKSRLAGNNPELSQDSQRYDQLGERSYVMVELLDYGITITLSRKGLLGFVSAIGRSEMLQFIKHRIFPLL